MSSPEPSKRPVGRKRTLPRSPPRQWIDGVAGATAGVVNAVFVSPLDVIKARQQLGARERYRTANLPTLLKGVLRDEGPRGFFRGIAPTLLGYLTTWGIYFTVYKRIKRKISAENAPPTSFQVMASAVCGTSSLHSRCIRVAFASHAL